VTAGWLKTNLDESLVWGPKPVESGFLAHPGLQYEPRPRSVMDLLGGLRRWFGRTFIVQGERRVSYEQFAAGIDAAAEILRGYGVTAGSRVLLLAYNSPEFALATWAIWRAGGVPVMGNRWWSQQEVDNAITLTSPIIALTDKTDYADSASTPTFTVSGLSSAWHAVGEVSLPLPEPEEDDIALILFTSGSTGVPKAVALSQRSIVANQQNLLVRSGRMPQDLDADAQQTVTLVSTPLFHVGGVSILITQPITGGRLVLNVGKFDPVQILEIIQAERVQNWGGVPTMASRVLEHPDFEGYDLSSLRSFPIGGAPLSLQLLDRLRKKLPQFERRGLANTWGMTESGGFVTVAGNRDLVERPGTVGRPYPVAELRISHENENGVGEILVRSPTVMLGYVGSPDDESVDAQGWLSTGDLGHLDADGYLFLDGRSKDIIIRGGENIASRHVEIALLEHPAVTEAAVVGMPHPDLGEEVAAVVVLRSDVAQSELREFLKSRIAYFELPTKWFLQREPLPTLPGEKVDKRRIKQERERAGWADESPEAD
jgi:long-chain acyl-CoA synthetase